MTNDILKEEAYKMQAEQIQALFDISLEGADYLAQMGERGAGNPEAEAILENLRVIGGVALQGLFPVTSAGLQIRKRSGLVLLSILSAAGLNVVLNLLLIPFLGIEGAAIATLLAYALMNALAAWQGRATVPVRPEWRRVLAFTVAAGVMYVALGYIHFDRDLPTLVVRMAVGAVIYAVAVLALDAESRVMATQVLARFGLGRGRGTKQG